METKNRIILVKEESTYGVDSSPVGANAIQARDLRYKYASDLIETDYVSPSLSPSAPITGKRWVEFTFESDIKGSGTIGIAPQLGDLFEACAFTETIGGTNGSSIIYTPRSAAIKSVTIYVYDLLTATTARRRVITGCRGNLVQIFTAGKQARAQFRMQGYYALPTDVGSLPTPAPVGESIIPPICESMLFTFNSYAGFVIQEMTMDMANNVEQIDDINSANALKEIRITGRRPAGRFNPEAVAMATKDLYSDWVASTQRAVTMNLGSVNFNKVAYSFPKVTLDGIEEDSLNGRIIENVPIKFNRNTASGNDELSMTFS